MEHIVRIIHLVNLKNSLQASLIKAGVVCHQWQALNLRCYLLPDIREHWGIVRIFRPQAMDFLAELLVVFRLRMNEAVERVNDLSATDDNHTHAANTARLFVRRLEIYCCKICHFLS